jgi:hypothetical protein
MHDDDEPRIQIRTSRGDLLSISLVDTGFPESAHLVPADEAGRLRVEDMHIR